MVWPDGQAVIRRVEQPGLALGAFEPDAESIEAIDKRCRRTCALSPLLYRRRARWAGHIGRRGSLRLGFTTLAVRIGGEGLGRSL